MLTFMMVFTSVAIVGATVTMQIMSGVADMQAVEGPVAANFVRYTEAVSCYARANPAWTGVAPDIVTLKAATYLGAPCLHPSINFVGAYYGIVTANQVMAYQPTGLTIRVIPVPAMEISKYTGTKYAVAGIVGADGVSIMSPLGGNVGALPPELQAANPRPAIGSPVRVLSRG